MSTSLSPIPFGSLRQFLPMLSGSWPAFWPTMQLAMFNAVIQFEVLWSIIRTVAILVVDMLMRFQRTAQDLLHDIAVLQDIATIFAGFRMIWHPQHDATGAGIDIAPRAALASPLGMACNKAPGFAMPDGGLLAATAFTDKRVYGWEASLLRFALLLTRFIRSDMPEVTEDKACLMVAQVRTMGNRLAAAAFAKARHRVSMAAQDIGRLIPEQVFLRDRLAATASAQNHGCLP